jgi:DNA-binding beta-propeller fold protein YncE
MFGLSRGASLYMGGGGFGGAAPAGGWNISGASYDSKSVSVSAHESTPEGLFFRYDGTNFYVVGADEDRLIQYNLSTAWDISTATFSKKTATNFLNAGGGAPTASWFKPDGTKMFLLNWASSRRIYQYSLSTAWDIATLSYDSVFGSLSGSGSETLDMYFKPDGTKVYTISSANNTIYQHSLSTAWDISTVSYDSKTFSAASQDSLCRGFYLKDDGTKLYVAGSSNDNVYQYSLSTAWDISTASYDSVSFSVTSQDGAPRAIAFKSDGAKMYMLGSVNDTVYQYSTV